MAQLIKEKSGYIEITPENGKTFSLTEMQNYVDGYIEIIRLQKGKIMVLNEEGKFTKELNIEATRIAHENKAIFPADYIAGDVVICEESEMK